MAKIIIAAHEIKLGDVVKFAGMSYEVYTYSDLDLPRNVVSIYARVYTTQACTIRVELPPNTLLRVLRHGPRTLKK